MSNNPLDSNCNKSSTKVLYPTCLSFCVLLLGKITFSQLFCWHRKHMSQCLVATVPLETRLKLRFDIFHSSLYLKNQQFIFKNKHWQCRIQSIFEDTVYLCYCKLTLVPSPPPPNPMVGAERMKIFVFDNPRLLEKALLGKKLHRKLLFLAKKY